MSTDTIVTIALICVALGFDFLNGFHDSANVVATTISSRALSPRSALLLAGMAEFSGPFVFGVAVATTIGRDIVVASAITAPVLLSALLGSILWNLVTWLFGIPSSSSHALIGGLVGAVAMGYGVTSISFGGLTKTVVALLVSPLLGLAVGFVLMRIVLWAARGATPKTGGFLKTAQIATSMALALSHGTNDAQKTMGIIAMVLLSGGFIESFYVPTWVIAACACAIALGTLTGAQRIIHTLGAKFYRVRPIHGFSAQLASALVILGAALLGGPVSTTHVVSSSILGVGSAERLSKVRWGVAQEILVAWFLTIPATMLMAAAMYPAIRLALS